MRKTHDRAIDENGVWNMDDAEYDYQAEVRCEDCGANHAYDSIHESGDRYTIALKTNCDPKPVATLAVAFRNGVVDAIGGDMLMRLIVIDEDQQEVGRYIVRPEQTEWWERMEELTSLIKKGEFCASFKEGKNED